MYSFPAHETIVTTDGVTCRVLIAKDCPFFAGHFPSNPVLPAIAHLRLVTEVYRKSAGPDVFMSSILQLRLNARIGADETVSVRVANPAPDGQSRFAIERDGRTVSEGIVTWRDG